MMLAFELALVFCLDRFLRKRHAEIVMITIMRSAKEPAMIPTNFVRSDFLSVSEGGEVISGVGRGDPELFGKPLVSCGTLFP